MDKINFENLPSTNTPITAENLNAMQTNAEKVGNYIGGTQPSTNENIWYKKGKNKVRTDRFSINYVDSTGNYVMNQNNAMFDPVYVKPSTEYTFSATSSCRTLNAALFTSDFVFISRSSADNSTKVTFTTPANCYIVILFVNYDNTLITQSTINNLSLQLEEGANRTTYEAYIPRETAIKNGNSSFEKFYHEDFFQNDNYKYGEYKIGTWVDGKPLYKKTIVIQNTAFSNGDNTVAHRVSNLKQCIKAELAKGGSNIFPYFNTSGNLFTSTTISNVDNSNITIRCINDTWGSGNVWYATLYYTKTTD